MPPLNDLRDQARQTLTEARSLLAEYNDTDETLPGDVAARADALIARGREEWQAYESALAVREREDQLADLDTAWRETPPPTASNPSALGGPIEITANDQGTGL